VIEGVFDAKKVGELGKELSRMVKNHPQSWDLYDKGTLGLVAGLNAGGILPTRNFLEGAFEQVDKVKWDVYEKELLTGRGSCYACAVRCKREVALDDRYQVSAAYGGPEYETVAGFTSNCGIDDLQAAAKANELCNCYTLDSISTSATIAFAMECFEHELIGLKETGGIELRFGNAGAMLQMVEMIAHRQGLGDLLAEGSAHAASIIGGEAQYFAMHVKGQELAMHEPRGKVNVGLGYAVSETGADHLVGIHDTLVQNPSSVPFQGAKDLGITQALPARDFSLEKVQQYFLFENWVSMGKVIGFCYFGPAPRSFIKVEDVITAVNATTGWNLDLGDLLDIGERATNLARLFNAREGFSRQDDCLPDRLFTPLQAGALAGIALSREDFERALTDLYRLKGWNPDTGVPMPERLEQLGLGWAINEKEAVD
jgi:aldehyde:ferredoxin oxidoreductase